MNIVRYLLNCLWNFLPLIVFLQTARQYAAFDTMKWLYAYEISSIVAAAHLMILFFRNGVVNRIVVGIDVYLLFGGFFTFFYQEEILLYLSGLQEAGLLFSIATVGLLSTLFSKRGFLGSDAVNSQSKKYSLYLLALAFFSALFSYRFIGRTLLAGAFPIIVPMAANKIWINSVDH